MRRFLLLALGMGFLLPTAVNAETWWLIVGARYKNFKPAQTDMISVPTSTEQECKDAGKKLVEDEGINGRIYEKVNFVCLKGK